MIGGGNRVTFRKVSFKDRIMGYFLTWYGTIIMLTITIQLSYILLIFNVCRSLTLHIGSAASRTRSRSRGALARDIRRRQGGSRDRRKRLPATKHSHRTSLSVPSLPPPARLSYRQTRTARQHESRVVSLLKGCHRPFAFPWTASAPAEASY